MKSPLCSCVSITLPAKDAVIRVYDEVYGRGGGVGRVLGVTFGLAVGADLAGGVGVAVGVAAAVGVAVGLGAATQYLPPVFK